MIVFVLEQVLCPKFLGRQGEGEEFFLSVFFPESNQPMPKRHISVWQILFPYINIIMRELKNPFFYWQKENHCIL